MNGYEQTLGEYRQLHELRKLWSGFIMDWLKVMIPIGGALFGFFSWLSKASSFEDISWVSLLPILGWLIFVVPMFTWRIVAHHLTRQITAMYPRILELEQRLGWTVHTIYYLNNLSPVGWRRLPAKVRTGINDLGGRRERRNYRLYRQACQGIGVDPHGLLLHVWEQEGYESVGSRGHRVQDVAVGIVSIVALAIACSLAFGLEHSMWIAQLTLGGVFGIVVICVVYLLVWPRRTWN